MNILEININEIKEYKNNPRFNDNAVEAVANSIKEFGFKVPMVVTSDYEIIAGHTRLKAAKQLGFNTVPCLIADDLTEEQIKAFRLADNKVGELAEWDFTKLEEELMSIQDIDMSDFEFDMSLFEKEKETEENEEEINTESNYNYQEQYGVIVMCKDEMEQQEVYERLMELGYQCKVVAT